VTKQTTPTTNIWGDRLLTTLTVFVGISFLAILVLGSYFDQPITQALSFDIEDGQCEPSTQGVGVHCFGDYQDIRKQLELAIIWDGTRNPYPPTGLLANVVVKPFENLFGIRSSLFAFTALLFLVVASPAIYSARKNKNRNTLMLRFSFLTIFAQPIISTLDRGNGSGFAVPFLTLYAFKLDRNSNWYATLAVAGAASIRPQFIVLAIGLLVFGQIKHFFISICASISIILIPFIFWPGNIRTNFTMWFSNITSYSSVAKTDVADKYPVNLSMRSVVDHIDTLFNNTVSNWIQINYFAISIAILIAIVGVLFACRRTNTKSEVIIVSMSLPCLIPETSFVYYSLFTVVLGTLIFTNSSFLERTETEILGTTSKSKHFYQWFVISAIAISLAPIPFVFEVGRNSIALEYFGLIWSIVLFWTLARLIMQNRKASVPLTNLSHK
jgi:hypothetical protein